MTVYELDANNFYIGFSELTEENKDILIYTTKPMIVGYYKPRFNHSIQNWEEGAITEEIEEIKRQEEANRPPVEPNEMEVLEKKVAELEEEKELLNKENKLLHAQVEVLSNTTDFHEELITEMAMKVYA